MVRQWEGYARSRTEEIDQLGWCVEHLHRIRKNRMAQVIQKNVAQTRRQMEMT